MKDFLLPSLYIFCWISVSLCQVIPGLSPSKPNRLLQTCMTEATENEFTQTYNNQPANSMDIWCRSYQTATPCLTKYLPLASHTDPNDWYLSLVYEEEYANKTSRMLCSKLKKYGNRMGCLLNEIDQAEMCVSMLTYPVATHLHQMYEQNKTHGDADDNSLRACLIPVTASKCIQQFFKGCQKNVRKLISRYFMLLSGKCLKIAKKHAEKQSLQADDDDDEDEDKNSHKENEDNEIIKSADKTDVTLEKISPIEMINTKLVGANDETVFEPVEVTTQPSHLSKTSLVPKGQDQTDPEVWINKESPLTTKATTTETLKKPSTPPVTIFKMKIIHKVVNSNLNTEPERKLEHELSVQTPDIKNDISVNIASSVGNQNHGELNRDSSMGTQTLNTDILIHKHLNRQDSDEETDTENEVVVQMTPVPEREVIHPGGEDEVKSILSIYSNKTITKEDSDSSDEDLIKEPTSVVIIDQESDESSEQRNDSMIFGNTSEGSSEEIHDTDPKDIDISQSSEEEDDSDESSETDTQHNKTLIRPFITISEETTVKNVNVKTKTHSQKDSKGTKLLYSVSNLAISLFIVLISST